jgi:membrane-associated phospholipid phosphatase
MTGFDGTMSVATPIAAGPTQPSRAAGLSRRLLLAATLSGLLAVGVYVLAVHTSLGHRFDNAALLGSRQQQTSTRASDISALQRITADSFAVVLLILVALGVLRRRPRLGIAVAVAAGVAVVLTDLLRRVLLHRPSLVRSDALYPANTFPSGHTATAIACALALVVVSAPAWRGVAAVLAGSYAGFTAAAVQTAGWHRPSDAIGAAFLSFAAVAVVAALLAAWRPIGSGQRPGHLLSFGVLGVAWIIAGALSALNAARVLRFLVDHSDTLSPTPAVLNDAYHFSIYLTVLVVVTLLAALLIMLGSYDLDEPRER